MAICTTSGGTSIAPEAIRNKVEIAIHVLVAIFGGYMVYDGWARVMLTKAGRDGPLRHVEDFPVLHWHGDTFELPNGASRLASTENTANQAFSFGASALAIQFHPEAEARNFERWLIGSVARQVIAYAHCAVTVVRQPIT